jgi:cell division septation protein DedD
MNNILKFLTVIVVVVLCYMLYTTTSRSFNNENLKNLESIKSDEVDFDDDQPTTTQDTPQKELVIKNIIADTNSIVQDETLYKGDTIQSKKALNTKTAQVVGVQKTQEEPKEDTKLESSPKGSILVIAGNYIQEKNAIELQKKLKKSGFENSEVAVFDFSEFHTVISGRYQNQQDAKARVTALKSKGFDAYTHVKK